MNLLYKPFGLLMNVLGGLAAAAAYRRLWRAFAHEKETPRATDPNRSWGQVLAASAMKGAVFAVVKAASSRSGAAGFASLTGTWPGQKPDGQSRK
jgi:Protein of unknown function (DUF4235)